MTNSPVLSSIPHKSEASFFRRLVNTEQFAAYMFVAPAFVIFLLFLLLPIVATVAISLTNWNGISPLSQTAKGASGQIIFTNQANEEILIPKGTELKSPIKDGVIYVTIEDVIIPAGSGSTQQGAVQASNNSLGRETNIRANAVTLLPDALLERVSVTNPLPISGGVDNAYEWVGTTNYQRLLTEEGLTQRDFFLSVKNTVYFVLGVVPTQTILALVLAVILNQRWLKAKGFFRTAFYFPSITSSVVISLVFMWMFTRGGLVNTILGGIFTDYQSVTWLNDANGVLHNLFGVFGINRATAGEFWQTRMAGITLWDWISGPSVTMFTIMILNTWTTIGTMMVIYLAALQSIPSSVYEAASIDGASMWQTFRRITVPLLGPTTFFVVTIGLIGTFQVFDQIFVISSGGPAKTTLTIAYGVYESGFRNSQMGLAAASALVLFVIIFLFTLLQRSFIRDQDET